MPNAQKPKENDPKDFAPKISFDLPSMIPAPHRAFVKVFTAEEIKLKSGLFVPGMSQAKDQNKNTFTLERKRYFLAAKGKDFNVSDLDGKPVDVGDELFMITYDDKSILVLPEIQDDKNNMNIFHVIDDLAVVGFRRSEKKE